MVYSKSKRRFPFGNDNQNGMGFSTAYPCRDVVLNTVEILPCKGSLYFLKSKRYTPSQKSAIENPEQQE